MMQNKRMVDSIKSNKQLRRTSAVTKAVSTEHKMSSRTTRSANNSVHAQILKADS